MLGLSQKQAAEALGLKRRMVQYYETGQRDGEKVSVPKTVQLACYALASGIADYHGPDAKQEAESAGGTPTRRRVDAGRVGDEAGTGQVFGSAKAELSPQRHRRREEQIFNFMLCPRYT